MKIDRLLSIIIYLLNRELVSAREMAERFGVTSRTIQRDMDAIGMAGIPIYTVQGPNGGYGILDSFKMDRSLVSPEDFYYILTSLRSVSESLGGNDEESSGELEGTLEKIKGLLPPSLDGDVFSERAEKLNIDFSMLGGDPRNKGVFRTVRSAVDSEHLIRFSYTSNMLKVTERIVEPMTVAFRWRSWYLYGWCRLRGDYRLFRISRIRNLEVLDEGFRRRDGRFEDFIADWTGDVFGSASGEGVEIILEFSPEMKPLAEEFHEILHINDDGSSVVRMFAPLDGWLYGYILSWGAFVRVLEPEALKASVREAAADVVRKYSNENGR